MTVIATQGVELEADLTVAESARGIVVFAHGSGSGRLSPRNRMVASTLQSSGLATLLLDLLTAEEERVDARTGQLRFDISLLARRVVGAVDWVADQPSTGNLPVGLFGASTGAAAALIAAAERPTVAAVVSRGGRPDLAGESLERVKAPTLLIVGSRDPHVLELNREAANHLRVEHEIVIVDGATHLFEERGALEQVSTLAADWFLRYA